MNEKKIVIDAGHGGTDSGAVGNGIIEKELTLKIASYIADRLRNLGADVTLTRDSDETLDPSERVRRVLNAYGNSKDVLVISNHINAGGGDGAEVIYALRGTDRLPNLILNNLKDEGQNIRKAYVRRLPSDPSKDYYFMLRNTGNTDALIVEYGFLDSKLDDVNQLKNNWQNYAEAVVKAVSEYLNIPYNQNTNSSIPSADGTYKVVSGDTLWSIAKKFDTTVNEIKRLNNLSNNLLKVGTNLIVPNGNNTDSDTYTVSRGDTLYSIARKNNISIDRIRELNNLTSDVLRVGQVLKLKESVINKYIVKLGDTLYSIASKFNTTVDTIKRLNNLTSNLLSIGQELIIE